VIDLRTRHAARGIDWLPAYHPIKNNATERLS